MEVSSMMSEVKRWTASRVDEYATTVTVVGQPAQGMELIATVHGATPDEAWANAHLIAAAPDLLAALDAMIKVWEGPRDRAALGFARAVNVARTAIARAKGDHH